MYSGMCVAFSCARDGRLFCKHLYQQYWYTVYYWQYLCFLHYWSVLVLVDDATRSEGIIGPFRIQTIRFLTHGSRLSFPAAPLSPFPHSLIHFPFQSCSPSPLPLSHSRVPSLDFPECSLVEDQVVRGAQGTSTLHGVHRGS